MTRAILYARVSTHAQETDRQLIELREVASHAGWEIVAEMVEVVSGGKGVEQRPVLKEALKAITQRKADRLCVLSLDRLGRSLKDLINSLETINAVGGHLYIHKDGLDTSTPNGKMMFQLIGMFAEFERNMISERVKSGMAAASKKGQKMGRPKRKVSKAKLIKIKMLRAEGMSYRKIADAVDMPFTSVRDELVNAA